MTYNFDSEVELNFDFDHIKLYESVVNAVLDEEECPYECEVNLCIVDDENIQTINKEQRDIDKSTDVLSFPMNDYDTPGDFSRLEEDLSAFHPDTGELLLGDIILSIDHIKNQAYEYGHSEAREYAFLIAHSMLHLCGYDHMVTDERLVMEDKQRIVMEMLYEEYPMLKIAKNWDINGTARKKE